MVGKLDDMMRFQQTVLSLRSQRQQLLASNIANADTPNYKARDIDFSNALQGALGRSANGSTAAGDLTKTSATHLSSSANQTVDGAPLLYSNAQQGSVDGNTVDLNLQQNQYADNAMHYEASLTLLTSKIKEMLTAIQGQ